MIQATDAAARAHFAGDFGIGYAVPEEESCDFDSVLLPAGGAADFSASTGPGVLSGESFGGTSAAEVFFCGAAGVGWAGCAAGTDGGGGADTYATGLPQASTAVE
jgi:hypothetical protein